MKQMLGAVLAAAIVAGCAGGVPDGGGASGCAAPEWEWQAYADRVMATAPGTAWVEFGADQVRAFLRAFNGAAPSTGFVYDRIGFFRAPEASYVLVAFIVSDCVWDHRIAPEAMVWAMAGGREL